MKIRIDVETYEFLADLTIKLNSIFEEILSHTERLMQVYSSVGNKLGPNQDKIEEIIRIIDHTYADCGDDLHELACIFASTAEKMGSFLNISYSALVGSTFVTDKSEFLKRRFYKAADTRLNDPASNHLMVKLYNMGQAHIKIGDYTYRGTPVYVFKSRTIYLDAIADLHDPTGHMSAYFHEVGHMLDHFFGNGNAWISSAPEYIEALRQDFDTKVQNVMIKRNCSREEAYDIISEELYGVWESNISDICGALSECRCQGSYGHHPTYWKEEPSRIAIEAFANMFEASIGSKEKKEQMQTWFPSSYECFNKLVKNVVEFERQ